MVAEPNAAPVTTPLNEPTGAIKGALLVHVPVPAADNVIADPIHTLLGPLMAGPDALTVNGLEIEHPVDPYVHTIDVVPGVFAVTRPAHETDAMVGNVLVKQPPVDVSDINTN